MHSHVGENSLSDPLNFNEQIMQKHNCIKITMTQFSDRYISKKTCFCQFYLHRYCPHPLTLQALQQNNKSLYELDWMHLERMVFLRHQCLVDCHWTRQSSIWLTGSDAWNNAFSLWLICSLMCQHRFTGPLARFTNAFLFFIVAWLIIGCILLYFKYYCVFGVLL